MADGKPKLLVVDDEKDIGEFVRFVASGSGYEVTCIINPQDFVNVYTNDTHVIILDLTMPEMDGVELIRYLSDVNTNAYLILMSGFDPGVLHSAREVANNRGLNVIGTLEKPISIQDLKVLLNDAASLPVRDNAQDDNNKNISEEELQQAMEQGCISNYYQPVIDLQSRFMVSIEALSRWQHPEKGLIMPEHYISLAEETGQINELTSQVIDQALEDCARLKAMGIIAKVGINISAKNLVDLSLPDQLQKKLIAYKLDPAQLVVEVTESAISEDIAHALDILTRIRMKGIHLSIDDFGTGYSSIQMLHRGPFDQLKIDMSFVRSLETDRDSKVIVETSIDMAHKLNIKPIAEGVESNEIWHILSQMECDEAQGNIFSPAIPVQDIPNWLAQWRDKQYRLCCA